MKTTRNPGILFGRNENIVKFDHDADMSKTSKKDIEMFRVEKICTLVGEGFKYITWIAIVWILSDAIKEIINHSPEQIGALATLIKEFADWFASKKFPELIGWFLAFVFFIVWKWERSGKKRAIEKLGECRKQLEANDPGGRSSSGLSVTGDTPRG